jgi:hypothetical protein
VKKNTQPHSKPHSERKEKKASDLQIDHDADIIDEAASDEPVRHMQGLKTVKEALRLEDFPMNREEIDYAVGDIDIDDRHGGYIPVYQLTEYFTTAQFESPQEVIDALKEARRKFKRQAA